jgi:hypothetical protein
MKKNTVMARSFLPVGQGAFYCEHFGSEPGKRINIVYDCGSTTDRLALRNLINCTFAENEEIEAVFISHFDDDHVNELEALFDRCMVKHLFLPVLTPMIRSIIELDRRINQVGYDLDLMDDTKLTVSDYPNADNTVIHAILPAEDAYNPEFDNTNDYSAYEMPEYGKEINLIDSGTDVGDILFDADSALPMKWRFVPYNFRNLAKYKKLMDAVTKEYKCKINPNKLLDMYLTNFSDRAKITRIYKKVFPGANANINSMTLFSGPADADALFQEDMYAYCSKKRTAPGCLFLGDYDACGVQKWKQLLDKYDEYWSEIGCLQVPHHGSRHNFNTKLLTSLDAFYVISAGTSNRFMHPHPAVMDEFMVRGITPHLVTELPGSAYYTYCSLKK